MVASLTDKFTDTYNAANPNVARVTATRSAGGSSLSCDNLAGWPTATKVHFSTYKINTSNAVVAGSQIDWQGIVSGTSIGSLTRITGATDNGSAIGDVVELNPTASWAHDLYSGLTVEHNQDGTHKAVTATSLTNAGTLTQTGVATFSSNLKVNDASTAVIDSSSNELVKFAKTASAVNEVTVTNAAASNAPSIAATGDDSNIDLNLVSKGTGDVKVNGKVVRGGGYYIGTLTPSGTGNLAVTGVGFKPRLVRFTVLPAASATANSSGGGAMTASARYAWSAASGSGGHSRSQSTTACLLLVSGGSSTAVQAADYVSMDSDGFTINFSAQNGTQVAYEALA